MTVTVLHVSDLHRDPTSHLGNAALLESLMRDADRIRDAHGVSVADLVVASGDIVQGVGLSVADPDGVLAAQYAEAESFLGSLADAFLGGDRNRLIVIPGNHDVHFPRVMQSLRVLPPINTDDRKALLNRLADPTSEIRWSWNTLEFSEVIDQGLYKSRLDHFAHFYGNFYGGARSFSAEPSQQVDIFDYPEFNVTVAAFCSCYNNDPLRTTGSIHPDCAAFVGHEFRKPIYAGRVLIAAYHHSTSGGPLQSDYMDSDILQNLMDYGVVMTLHGHQHRADVIDQRFALGGMRRVSMVSAGTLCGGPATLPTGQMRGYNLVEIDEPSSSLRVYPRRMHNQNFAAPVWGPAQVESPAGCIAVKLDPAGAKGSVVVATLLGRAEKLIGEHHPAEALELLTSLRSHPLARRFILQAALDGDNNAALIEYLYPPLSVAEGVHLAVALAEEGRIDVLKELLSSPLMAESTDPAVREIRKRFSSGKWQ